MAALSLNLTAALACEGWMEPDELEWLAEQAQSCQTIIEVGCWKGRSTLALAENTRGTVYAVDHWQGTPGDAGHVHALKQMGREGLYRAFRHHLGRHIATGRVMPMRESALSAALSFAPHSADLVFLDAGHREADVRQDIETYRPIVKAGGMLCGHDYANPNHPGVTAAVDALCGPIQRAGFSIWWVRR